QSAVLGEHNRLDHVEAFAAAILQIYLRFFPVEPVEQMPCGIAQPEEGRTVGVHQPPTVVRDPQRPMAQIDRGAGEERGSTFLCALCARLSDDGAWQDDERDDNAQKRARTKEERTRWHPGEGWRLRSFLRLLPHHAAPLAPRGSLLRGRTACARNQSCAGGRSSVGCTGAAHPSALPGSAHVAPAGSG